MKTLIKSMIAVALMASFVSCSKDEEKDEHVLPTIQFKTGGDYVHKSQSVTGGSEVTIGIIASKSEEKDPLIRFDITEAVNGKNAKSVYNRVLTGSEGDQFSYDYTITMDTTKGDVHSYSFTITNRDGLVNQVALNLTIAD